MGVPLRRLRIAPLLCGAVLAIAAAQAPARESGSVQFVAFGDAGTGQPPQYAVGKAMAKVCAARGCDFGIELGDNFYPSGVQTVDDPQFEQKFEKPYAPLDVPIYVALGNHDTGLNGSGANNERGDVQVEYAASGRSKKFRMPARYYRFTVPEKPAADEPPLAEFFALDSNPIAATGVDSGKKWAPEPYALAQGTWLANVMIESKARWKIVFAHHPYISNGLHGNAGHFRHPQKAAPTATGELWRRLLSHTVCRQGADLFLAGHDHDMEWLKPTPVCGKTGFIVSGLGGGGPSELRGRNPSHWRATDTYGFFWIRLRDEELTVAAYTLRADLSLRADDDGRPSPTFEQTVPRP